MSGEHKIVGGAREYWLSPHKHESPHDETYYYYAYDNPKTYPGSGVIHVIEYSAYESAIRERDLAIAHDRQAYPTASAYEQVCKLLESEREKNRELKSWYDSIVAEYKKEREEQAQKYLDTANKYNDIVDKLTEEREKLAICVELLRTKVAQHREAYSTDIIPDYTLKENPNPSIDQVGGKMGRHMCDCFLRYIDETLAEIKESK